MPGVPSGLGCDACRKAKKKCDLTKPSCQNCIRRGIPCVGVGVKRWKFMDSNPSSSSSSSSSSAAAASSSSSSSSSSSPSPPPAVVRHRPSRPPSNETTRMAASLAHLLGTQDIKYDAPAFGGQFMADLPRRVGSSPLLDATVSAAVASYHAIVHRGAAASTSQELQQKAFTCYGAALQALRSAMEAYEVDSPQAIPTRIYSILLISFCQEWIDPDKDTGPHREMLTHLLRRALRGGRLSEIDNEYLYPLCQTLVWEAWVNPRLDIQDWLWAIIDISTAAGPRPHRYRDQRTRLPFASLDVDTQARTALWLRDPMPNMAQLRRVHAIGCADRVQMRALVAQMRAAEMAAGSTTTDREVLKTCLTHRVTAQIGLGMMIFLGSGLNRAMQRFPDLNPDLDLAEDMHAMVDDAIQIAGLCADLRPFGSMFVPKILKVVWACLPDDDRYRRVEVEAWLRFFESDFEGADYVEAARGLRERLDVVSGRSSGQGVFTEGIYTRAMEVRTGSR